MSNLDQTNSLDFSVNDDCPDNIVLTISIGKELSDCEWEAHWEAYSAELKKVEAEFPNELRVSFSKCVWADPIPLLSLTILIHELVNQETNIVISFDLLDSLDTRDPIQAAKKRLLVFLYTEGFLASLLATTHDQNQHMGSVKIQFLGKSIITPKICATKGDLDNYFEGEKGSIELVYAEASCITAQVFSVSPGATSHVQDNEPLNEKLHDIVMGLLNDAASKGLKRRLSQLYEMRDELQDEMLYEEHYLDLCNSASPTILMDDLRQILTELIQNIFEHAYPKATSTKYCAVYARLRQGTSNGLLTPRQRGALEERRKLETKQYTELTRSDPILQQDFLELFIVDSGVGIAHNIRDQLDDDLKKSHFLAGKFLLAFLLDRPSPGEVKDLRELIDDSRAERKKTPFSGLNHTMRVLKNARGFVRLYSERGWAGLWTADTPHEGSNGEFPKMYRKPEATQMEHTPAGTSWHIRIPLAIPVPLNESWNVPIWGQVADNKEHVDNVVAKAYSLDGDDDFPVDWNSCQFLLYDDIPSVFELETDASESNPVEVSLGGCDTDIPDAVFWRPKKICMRSEIIDKISKISRFITSRFGERYDGPLFIVDQDISTAHMTALLFDNLRLTVLCGNAPSADVAFSFSEIWVVNEHYAYTRLKIISDDYGPKFSWEPTTDSSLENSDASIHLGHIVSILRDMDSRMFWKAILKSPNPIPLWAGEFRWTNSSSEDILMNRYLSFPTTLNIRTCRWVYRRSLSRYISFLSPTYRPVPIDHLVNPIIYNFTYVSNKRLKENVSIQEEDAHQGQASTSNHKLVCLLGSIAVTGESAINAKQNLQSHLQNEESFQVCFFLPHPQLKDQMKEGDDSINAFLLYWNARHDTEEPITTNVSVDFHLPPKKGQKVVDSPFVARMGNYSWAMCRTIEQKGQREELYGRHPGNPTGLSTKRAVSFWQDKNVIRIGHWNDRNRHDLISIDVIGALKDDAKNMEGRLWEFLRSHFTRILRPQTKLKKETGFDSCHVIGYFGNETTIYVIDRILALPEFQDFKNLFVKLSPIHMHRKSISLRIHPQDLELLAHVIRTKKEHNTEPTRVLLFCDQYSSQRTFSELETLIYSAGADDVHSVGIIDRTRIPNVIIGEGKWQQKHSRLWRLDLDYLASDSLSNEVNGCYICYCREQLQKTLRLLPSSQESARKRLSRIISVIRDKSISLIPAELGLDYELHFDRDFEIKFGLKPRSDLENREYFEYIPVRKVSVLCGLLVQIVTITGDHDVIDRYLDKLPEAFVDDEDGEHRLLSSQLLLLATYFTYTMHDMNLNRKIHICEKILELLFQNRHVDGATGLGTALMFGLESQVANRLAPKVSDLMVAGNGIDSMDALLATHGVLSVASPKVIQESAKLASALLTLSSTPDSLPVLIHEISMVLGLRPGKDHETMLKKTFDHLTQDITQDSISKLQQLSLHLNKLISLFTLLLERFSDILINDDNKPKGKKAIEKVRELIRDGLDKEARKLEEILNTLEGRSFGSTTTMGSGEELSNKFKETLQVVSKIRNKIYGSGEDVLDSLIELTRQVLTPSFAVLDIRLRTMWSDVVDELQKEEGAGGKLHYYEELSSHKVSMERINNFGDDSRINIIYDTHVERCLRECMKNMVKHGDGEKVKELKIVMETKRTEHKNEHAIVRFENVANKAVISKIKRMREQQNYTPSLIKNELYPLKTMDSYHLEALGGRISDKIVLDDESKKCSIEVDMPMLTKLATVIWR